MSDGPALDPAKPLAGRSVIVTRTREQAAALARPLEALGAEVIALPVIEIVDPADWAPVDIAIAHLTDYDWVVFTSTNGVERLVARVREHGLEPAERFASAGVRIAAVGTATAERLASAGVRADAVPASRDFRAEGLIEAFRVLGAGDEGHRWRVLLPRALEAREILPDTLRELGCEVDVVPVYRTITASPDPALVARLAQGGVDAVTFTSGSTVRNFLALLKTQHLEPRQVMEHLTVASIGPVTTQALEERGYEPDVEAAQPTMAAMAAAVGEYFRARA